MQKCKIILAVLLIASGCSSIRNTEKTEPNKNRKIIMLSEVDSLNFRAQDFNIQKANVKVVSNEGESEFLVNFKYKHPDVYLVSLKTRTGIEAARIYISADTILINDRIKKRLFYGSAGYLYEKYGVNVTTIQLLLGGIVMENSRQKGAIVCEDGFAELDEILENRKISYRINCSTGRLTETLIETSNNEAAIKVKLNWSKSLAVNGIPGIINIKDEENRVEIKIEISKAEYGLIEEIVFVPGKNYEMILLK